ncbi:unnamed protein product [Spodoptera exigua]|nr:unnamed protein product [Spodoptera exigua]
MWPIPLNYTVMNAILLATHARPRSACRREPRAALVCHRQECWSTGSAGGAGQTRRRQVTGPRQETAGEGIPGRAQWRRRAAGGALAIDMPSLRSDGRCERFGALQRRMPPARAPHAPRSPHLLCIYRAAQPAQGCRDVDFTTAVDVYLTMRCRHARNVRTHAAPAADAARVTPDCLLFVTMNIKIAPSVKYHAEYNAANGSYEHSFTD